jgi:hypothetical protein
MWHLGGGWQGFTQARGPGWLGAMQRERNGPRRRGAQPSAARAAASSQVVGPGQEVTADCHVTTHRARKHHVGNVPRLHGENHLSAHCAGGGVRACCLQVREPARVVPTLSWFQLLTCAIYRCGFNPQESSLPGRKRRTGCFSLPQPKTKGGYPQREYPPQGDDSFKSRTTPVLCGVSISNPEFFKLISHPYRISGKMCYSSRPTPVST